MSVLLPNAPNAILHILMNKALLVNTLKRLLPAADKPAVLTQKTNGKAI